MKTAAIYGRVSLLRAVSRLRALSVGKHASALLTETENGRLLVPASDVGVGRHLAYHGSYDRQHLALYKSMITPASRVLVVGAHVGAIALPLAKIAREVVAVEANPETFDLLRLNVLINDLNNVSLIRTVAADRSGQSQFVMSKVNSGGSKIKPQSATYEFYFDAPHIVEAPAHRLDDVVAGEFDLIIVDIEGGEYSAFGGMPRLLSSANALVVEVVPNHLNNVSGVSFHQFMERIPDRFGRYCLNTAPEKTVGRHELDELYRVIEEEHYFGGCDLVCTL